MISLLYHPIFNILWFVIQVFLYYLLIKLSIFFYRFHGFWPSSIWYHYTRPKHSLLNDLDGWSEYIDRSNIRLWLFWYLSPISREEWNERIKNSQWISPRGIDYNIRYLDCQPIWMDDPFFSYTLRIIAHFWFFWSNLFFKV